jgi:hypothetical protein
MGVAWIQAPANDNDGEGSLREAIVTDLKADGALTTIVPAARVYGMRQPADTDWPFTRYGAPSSSPRRATCLDGSDVDITLHAFSKQPFEDECAEMVAAMASRLDGKVLHLPDGARAHMRWTGNQIIPDAAEASAWHGLSRFVATITS